MRGNDQITMFDTHVIDRRDRETALHACPAAAIIHTDENACLGADKQQAGPFGIGTDHTGNFILREMA